MSHIDGKMTYTLKRPVEMPVKGNFRQVEFIELSEFTGKHFEFADKLECAITKAFMEMRNQVKERSEVEESGEVVKSFTERTEDDHELQSDEYVTLIEMALKLSSVDRAAFVNNFKKMVTFKGKPLAMVEGESPMTAEMFEDMHPKDMVGMAVAYCANFTIGLDFLEESGSSTSTTQSTGRKAL